MNKSVRGALRKLHAYNTNPEIVKEPSLEEMASLVVFVLNQVKVIEKAIKEGRLDGKTPEADKDYLSKETAIKLIRQGLDKTTSDILLSTKQKINSLQNGKDGKDGKDGIITDAEIQRAAGMARSLIDLPDFDSLVKEAITKDGASIRNALELLSGEDRYIVEVEDVKGLQDKLNQLSAIRSSGGGTIGKQQVYGFIRQAVLDGTISTGSSLPDQSGNSGKFLTTDGTDASWATLAGGGDMAAATYDPNAVAADAFDMDNMVEGADTKILTAAERSAIAANTAKVTNATHTGDVTGTTALTIANDAVTFDKIQNIATNRVLARDSAGTGSVEALTLPNFRTLINVEDGADVTDTANVTAAGALMDSEVTNLADVKAFDPADYATAAQGSTADSAVQPADLDDYALKAVAPNAQTGTTYTLVLTDASKTVTMNNAGANTLTVPPNASVAFPVGTRLMVQQLGAGATTIAAGAGVTINAPTTVTLAIDEQYESRGLLKTASPDTWTLI